ncbi:hypothetical protein J9303_04695 [Bacillaceae bacterium Marseille-Q3522]|nr:hypothetical protein [Bacillaceae bacterium Marseille-Q3522]
MFLLNYVKLIFLDWKKAQWKIWLCIAVLFIGAITFIKVGSFPEDPDSIPDVFEYLFQKENIYVYLIPVFLVILSFVLPPILDPLRLFRFRNRNQLAAAILFTVLLTVLIFLLIYFLIGFLYGWLISGTVDNPWATKEGKPYKLFEGNVDLALFQSGYMILRYTVTQFFAFLFIGLLSALLYLLIRRYIIVFLIVSMFAILDNTIEAMYLFSLFLRHAEVKLGNWGNVQYFLGHLYYFLGLIVVLCVAIYFVVARKDFIQQTEEKAR